MPYKIGFQAAGVRNNRTADFIEERRRCGEERKKEEGRLGRRWAKVSPSDVNSKSLLNGSARRPAFQPDHSNTAEARRQRQRSDAIGLVVIVARIHGRQAEISPFD